MLKEEYRWQIPNARNLFIRLNLVSILCRSTAPENSNVTHKPLIYSMFVWSDEVCMSIVCVRACVCVCVCVCVSVCLYQANIYWCSTCKIHATYVTLKSVTEWSRKVFWVTTPCRIMSDLPFRRKVQLHPQGDWFGFFLNVEFGFVSFHKAMAMKSQNWSEPALIARKLILLMYRGAYKSIARPTSRCILFDGDNISFDASLVIYIYIYI